MLYQLSYFRIIRVDSFWQPVVVQSVFVIGLSVKDRPTHREISFCHKIGPPLFNCLPTFIHKTPIHKLRIGCFDLCGRRWIRTTEGVANRFTVCPIWPLWNSPICFFALRADGGIRTPDQLITNQLLWPTELHRH